MEKNVGDIRFIVYPYDYFFSISDRPFKFTYHIKVPTLICKNKKKERQPSYFDEPSSLQLPI